MNSYINNDKIIMCDIFRMNSKLLRHAKHTHPIHTTMAPIVVNAVDCRPWHSDGAFLQQLHDVFVVRHLSRIRGHRVGGDTRRRYRNSHFVPDHQADVVRELQAGSSSRRSRLGTFRWFFRRFSASFATRFRISRRSNSIVGVVIVIVETAIKHES